MVSSFILEQRDQPQRKAPPPSAASQVGDRGGVAAEPDDSQLWSLEKLQAYIQYVKTLAPTLTRESEAVLSKYYQKQRQAVRRCAGCGKAACRCVLEKLLIRYVPRDRTITW